MTEERNQSNIKYLLPENSDHCCRIGRRKRERDFIITNWANAIQCSLSRKYLSDSKEKISDSEFFLFGNTIKAYKRQKT